MKKIAIVWGTRPEIIKLSRVIHTLRESFELIQIHTGQHYDKEMLEIFLKELEVGHPDFTNKLLGSSNTEQFVEMQTNTFIHLDRIKPDVVIVQGDTNSALVGALCANKLRIKLVHIEAGGRSYNREMPEESNRRMIDHISDILISYDDESYDILKREDLERDRVLCNFQNTSFEVTKYFSKKIDEKSIKCDVLVTAHRQENVDNKEKLTSFINFLNESSKDLNITFPVHPRTSKRMQEFKIKLNSDIKNPGPVGYFEVLELLKACKYVITDSGGLVDDAMVMKKPVFIYRDKIEQNRILSDGLARLIPSTLSTVELVNYFKNIKEEDLIKMKTAKNNLDFSVSKKIKDVILKELT